MTAALEGGEWSAARSGRTLPPEKTRYPFYRRLGGPQGWSGRAENLVHTGIGSPDRPVRSQSLYRLSYRAHDQEGNKPMFLSEWGEYPFAPSLAGKKNLMTARVSMLLKSHASLTCFRACFLPGRAKDLSAPRYLFSYWSVSIQSLP